MNKKELENLYYCTHFLIHFKNVKNDSVFKKFLSFINLLKYDFSTNENNK